jgi:ABC-type antimicrobial peptide transport system permease subunit
MDVVGVVGDARAVAVGTSPAPMFFVPVAQRFDPRMKVFIRGRGGDLGALGVIARGIVRELDPSLTIASIETLDDVYGRSIGRYTTVAGLVGALGVLALVLAGVGLYAVLSFLVGQRTREIGIRMALGARAEHVVQGVASGGVRLVAIGVGIGLAVALAATRFLATFLFGVTPADPVSYLAAGGVLLAAAFVASYVPARRATHVDPVTALRIE